MTHTKQIISALLAFVLLLSLCACSGGGSSTADSSSAQVLSGNDNVEPQTSPAPQGDAIDQMISKMSVEEKVGQMFYALCPSVGGGEFVAQYHLGGCLLSGDFFDDKSADDVRATIRDIQSRTLVPLLFGVDEEGGTVVRVSYHQQLRESAFDSPKNYYQNGGWEAVEAAETEKAELLTSLGINVNNAPVCDITSNTESFIYDRSFSGDVDEVNTFVKKVVDIYKSKKLGTVLKHFPGYGDNTDTHEDMSYDARSLDEFRASDFIPFTEGINEGADCVMVAHNIMADVDEEYPASLSAKAGNITGTDFEEATLVAGGGIGAEVLTGCMVKSVTGIDCTEGFGRISGGEIYSTGDINCIVVGTREHAETHIVMGESEEFVQETKKLETQISKLDSEIDKINVQVNRIREKEKEGSATLEDEGFLEAALRVRAQKNAEKVPLVERVQYLSSIIALAKKATLRAKTVIYGGTYLKICGFSQIINSDRPHATAYSNGTNIVVK